MFDTFIKRPVLSLVISLLIVLLGLLALFSLPVTQFPDIVPPSVTVTAKYTGANAEVCAKAVATPLERAINGVPGMTYMSSVSSNTGVTLISVSFAVGTDPDQAAVNVQNRVATILDELPEEVIKAGVSTEKEVNSMLLYLNIMSEDSTLNEKFIYNFADINVLQELKRIDGVGFAEIMGAKEYAMRVWLKPDRMLAYSVSAEDVVEAIRRQNIEAAPGKTGEAADNDPQVLQYVLRYTGKFFEAEQYQNLIVRANTDGSVLLLKDIADVEFGALSYGMVSKTDGKPSASIMLKQRPGSNAQDVIANVKKRMEEMKATSFPPGMTYNFNYDVSRFLDASIHEVLRTLVEAFILVFIVVFLFIQDFRSTLIPALAVPVALIGTLAFMQMMGFSINLLTLFALVLAIGIVVDNAIVVVEAVHVKMHEHHMAPLQATLAAMREISGALVAITLVMSAVFVPVAFLSGPVGVFYRQFSLTLAIAIVISGINAVTLTPALCAIMLKNHHTAGKKRTWLQKFFDKFNYRYNQTEKKYQHLVGYIAGRRMITIGMLVLFFIATWGVSAILPGGFIPSEDQGMIYVNVTTPAGATVSRTEAVLDDVQKIAANLKETESVSTLAGYSLVSEVAGASYGMGMVNLKPWEERKRSVKEIIAQLEKDTRNIGDASIEFFPPPTVPGFGNSSGFELRVLDKSGTGDLKQTADVTKAFINALKERKEIGSAFTSFDPDFPQYMIHVDQAMAAKKGVSIDNAMSTLQTLLGSYYASNFIRFGQMYKVMVQASPRYRTKPEDILHLYVKNDKGEMVAYSNFIKLERVFGPEQLTRYNMYTAAMINGDAAPGYSSGDAIKAIEEVAKQQLPRGFSYEWSGMTREQILSGNQAVYIFAIVLLFVYLLLAAQYESFLLPLPVILSLPAGIFGAFFTLKLAGLENNIYAQVALVMLVGLLGKNAILIVEFAILKHKQGATVLESAMQGAVSRLRPILMTSFAFIAGLIPLCIASGAGAMGNRSIGTAAAGGMLIGTVFGVLVIPGLYVLFASIAEKRRKPHEVKAHHVVTVLVLGLFMSSCYTPKAVEYPDAPVVPATFDSAAHSGVKDTSASTPLSYRQFFADPYLQQLLDTALHNNTDIRLALQRVEMTKAQLMVAGKAWLPAVNAAVDAGVERYGDYTMNGVGNYDTNLSPNIDNKQRIPDPVPNYFIGLKSAWEIDLWGKLKNGKRAAQQRMLASEQGRRLVSTQLIANVAGLYYQLLALDNERSVLERNIVLQETALATVRIQQEAGRATLLAVQQFHAQLLNTQSLMMSIQQQATRLENQLNALLGRFPQAIPRDTSLLTAALPPVANVGMPATLLSHRPDIQQAALELGAAKADVAAAKAAFLPSLNINPYVGFNSFKGNLLFNTGSVAYGLLGGITAPILNKKQLAAQYQVNSASALSAFYNYRQRVIDAYQEVMTALARLHNGQEAFRLKEAEVMMLKAGVSTANDLYITGYANYLEVIMAQRSVLEAELALADSRRELFLGSIELYRALGGM
ncbi:efflux RND transporter permease subunit [Chitinophaga sancti]|uniref:Efflux RND transporter permease subunit n=1 Tax=Chitinophaga sancti TaxID=1004 RepID=A0A1K1RXK8_9BACT|nr:efflux RND transporter permease subunit [Chitinophaga sancti]WQD64062.1 efflux RND transporter permease subunit [Chitinophaga sancti]WQG90314.1 efflux RND transporter permease subunit [Chitinophaga sancti]SFW76801.1 hydrophobic/amphiphilic exporter-1, HAE1 family [Chitinophaga sancti]